MGSEPLYVRISADIERKIISGDFPLGSMLPNERELMSEYVCSRYAIRQAIELLNDRGYVAKRQGAGTYVSIPRLYYDNNRPISFTEEMNQKRKFHTTRVLKFETITSDYIAKELGIEKNSSIIQFRRLRLIENEPAILETSYLPQSRFIGLNKEMIVKNGLYMALLRNFGVFRMTITEKYIASFLSQDESHMLNQDIEDPVIQIIRHVTHNNEIIEYTEALTNSVHYPIIVNTVRG